MTKLVLLVVILIVLAVVSFVSWAAYKIHKGEREAVSNILLTFQHDFDEFQKSKAGQLIKKEVLLASKAYLENYASLHYPKLKPIFSFVFNKILLSTLIEENMPVVKKTREIEKELFINKAINFGIAKGAELLVNETKNYDVGGDRGLTHESQLLGIAEKLNLEAKDKGFVGAYAEFKNNFKGDKNLTTGAIFGKKL